MTNPSTDKEIIKGIEELQFASCPTEEKGILWRWTREGKEILAIYISNLLSVQKQEIIRIANELKKVKNYEKDGAGVVIIDVYNQALSDILEKL